MTSKRDVEGKILFFILILKNNKPIIDFAGHLHIFVDKIPEMTIDGEGNLEMNEEEREFTDSVSIIYRGDGDVEPPPTTFQVR